MSVNIDAAEFEAALDLKINGQFNAEMGDEVTRISSIMKEMRSGPFDEPQEVARFTSRALQTLEEQRKNSIVEAALHEILRRMDLENNYLDHTEELPLEDDTLPEYVIENGWKMILPIVQGLRITAECHPSDGDTGGQTYVFWVERPSQEDPPEVA